MKAIINNNITYKVTGERGDYFITEDNNGKLKMFAKNTIEVSEIDSMPKAKVFKKVSKKPLTADQKIKNDRDHAYFMANLNLSVLQDNFTDSQIRTGNYNVDLIR